MKHPFIDNSLEPQWQNMQPDCIVADITYALEEAKNNLEALKKETQLTYDRVMLPFEKATEDLSNAWGKVGHLDSVCNNDDLREAYNSMLPIVSSFYTNIHLDAQLWNVIKMHQETSDAQSLTGIKKRFLEEVVADFIESGTELEDASKKQLEEINSQLAKLTQKYSENVLDATNAWELIIEDINLLSGLPDSAIHAAKENAIQKGKENAWRFTLQAPSLIPLMKYLDNDNIRKTVWEASNEVGRTPPYDNTQLIDNILNLRQQKAQLLGYNNFADLTLKRRMAKTGNHALSFIEDLHKRVQKAFKQEIADLEAFKAKKTNAPLDKLQPWEVSYWAEKQRKERFDFDSEELRPYFPMDRVMTGMFEIASKLFSINIHERQGVSTWHPDVSYYDVYEKSTQEKLGSFYADWYPREPKRGGAWMNHLITGDQGQPHLGLICGNMTRPTQDKPALLTHDEVETIFHEFGHLLHHLLGDVEVKSLHGTQVAWDFVELPSQIMENFCWERESLDLFARHYQTGETIPDTLFKKMVSSRNYLSGMDTMRQLSIGKMDLELHINYQHSDKDLQTFVEEVLKEYVAPYKTKQVSLVWRLGHVFADPTGYASGYYSYKWAEVLDADAFTRFKKEGILNETVGLDFREKILSQGNSAPADILFKNFMGRDPDLNASLNAVDYILAKKLLTKKPTS